MGIAGFFQLIGSIAVVSILFIIVLAVLIISKRYKYIMAGVVIYVLLIIFLIPFFTNISFRSVMSSDRYFECGDFNTVIPLPPHSVPQMTLQYGFNFYSKSGYNECIEFYDTELSELLAEKKILGYEKNGEDSYIISYDESHNITIRILKSLWAFSIEMEYIK